MSEKYKQIGAPMNQLPRPVTTGNYSRIESALSAADRGGTGSIRFHDCSHNASMTILRDLKEMVSFKSGRLDSWKVKDRQKISSLNVKLLKKIVSILVKCLAESTATQRLFFYVKF